MPDFSRLEVCFAIFLDRALGDTILPVSCSSNALSSVAVPVKFCSVFRKAEREIASGSREISPHLSGSVSVQICVSCRKASSNTRDSISRPVQCSSALGLLLSFRFRTKLESVTPLRPVVPEIIFIGSLSFIFRRWWIRRIAKWCWSANSFSSESSR